MKQFLIIIYLLSAAVYGQVKNAWVVLPNKFIFIKLVTEATDSIVSKTKPLQKPESNYKFKRRRDIEFSVYSHDKKYDLKKN